MYTGFNAKKARKQTKIERLERDNRKMAKLIAELITLNKELTGVKNERTQSIPGAVLPTLSDEVKADSVAVEEPCEGVSEG